MLSLAKSQAVPPMTQPAATCSSRNFGTFFRLVQAGSVFSTFALPTSAGSRPALTMPSSMFSTTACDCATTPTRQPCCSTRHLITREPAYVLPVPGGPWTAT